MILIIFFISIYSKVKINDNCIQDYCYFKWNFLFNTILMISSHTSSPQCFTISAKNPDLKFSLLKKLQLF